jgi:hypothetical protein
MQLIRLVWKRQLRWRLLAICLTIGSIIIAFNIAHLTWSLVRWKAHIWAKDYWTKVDVDSAVPDSAIHLIFVMVDHYEPGKGQRGSAKNKVWCETFRAISDSNRDSYGNRYRHSWFYPFDHRNDTVMIELAQMAYEGFGEIEMHWHIDPAMGLTNQNFGDKLHEAVLWYQQFGAMVTAEKSPRSAFAYIAGNWDLDASREAPICHGITNQIEELVEHGCYADFTYSTIGVVSQPAKVNSLYYVEDDPQLPKSHDDGTDVRVGMAVNDKLLIFQGPITLRWNGALEYSAIETYSRFRPERIATWIDADIHVHGRPEWIFVKVHTHGVQSADTLLEHDLPLMLEQLKSYCDSHGINLHYMTAREAFNVVKAAEEGKVGDPEDYRDFKIPKYRNMVFDFPQNRPLATESASEVSSAEISVN